LNRKPHPHRIAIVENLIAAGLQDQGYISLGLPGGQAITIQEEFYDEQGIRDEYGNLGTDETFVSKHIRNDIFSLGVSQVWNNSLLCLVSETEFSNYYPENFFASEKTFKPILGMRPFFVYGQPGLRQHLQQSGFDTFEDVFDYKNINENTGDPERQRQYSQVAIDAVNRVSNPAQEYTQKYFGRCQYNKNHFRAYVYQQWQRLHDLDLTQYV
jgi:hypothetical protein